MICTAWSDDTEQLAQAIHDLEFTSAPTKLTLDGATKFIRPVLLESVDKNGQRQVVMNDARKSIRNALTDKAATRLGHHGYFAARGDVHATLKVAAAMGDFYFSFTLGILTDTLPVRDTSYRPNFAYDGSLPVVEDGIERIDHASLRRATDGDCTREQRLERIRRFKKRCCPSCCLRRDRHYARYWCLDSIRHIFLHCPAHSDRRMKGVQDLTDFVCGLLRELELGGQRYSGVWTAVQSTFRFERQAGPFAATDPLAAMFGVFAKGELAGAIAGWFPAGLVPPLRVRKTIASRVIGFLLRRQANVWCAHRKLYVQHPASNMRSVSL